MYAFNLLNTKAPQTHVFSALTKSQFHSIFQTDYFDVLKLPSWKSEEIPLFYPWQTNYTLLQRQKALPLFVGTLRLI